ncbi:MAG: DNA-binding transcriptional LysR family regulator [Paracoccaceae bacterium]|jgi:DNA-binding transcriptional LysR family regulator
MRSANPDKFVTNLDWNLLRTFVVIVEEGGITAAATRLLRRQPTVSLALARLEAQIGNRLIDRGGGTFRLTAVGRELFKECAGIYQDISRLEDVTSTVSEKITGNIQISLASSVVTPVLDEVLTSFHRKFPAVTYRIGIDTSEVVVRNVLEKSATLGVCLLNKRHSKLVYRTFYREFFGFYCGPPHPLFGKRNLEIADLQEFPAVSFGTDSMADALRPVALFRQLHGLDQDIIGHSPHLEEVRRMIMCGLGIGPLPTHVAERDVRDGLLWRLPPYSDPPMVDVLLVTNPSKRLNPAEAGFLQALNDRIEDLPMPMRTYEQNTIVPVH